ncbi:MAG: M28 family peptidase, partial [Candidatus Latescibacteria bacterium]|nr:M28 family peptidase [Candidatus Latescibacterota bacterium]
MKRRDFLSATGVSVLSSAIAYGCSTKSSLPDSSQLVETPRKRGEYLERMLKTLCTDIGPHSVGSPEFQIAAQIVKQEMELALPVVEFDPFTFERWVLKEEPELYVGDQKLEAFPGHGTSGTSPDGITGTLTRIDKNGIPYGLVDKSGEVIAYITKASYVRAVPLPYYSFKQEVKCFPTFNVGLDDIQVIEMALENKTPVRMKAMVEFIPDTETKNVVGTLPGESTDEILFLAHLDTVYNTQGANDNTASVIAMLMLAHSFSGVKPRKTLTFLATEGEEYNKLGAINYAERRKREGTYGNIKFLVNFDSITWGSNMKIFTKDAELCSLIERIDRDLNIKGTPELIDSDGFA